MKKFIGFMFAIIFICFSVSAFATEGKTYFGIQAGPSFLSDSTISAPGFYDSTLSFDSGYAAGFMLGHSFSNNFRIEGEYTIRKNDISSVIDAPGYPSRDTSGDVSVNSLMGNVYYDIKTPESRIYPYVGVGIGFSDVNFTTKSGDVIGDTVFSYQLIGGVAVPLSTSITLDVNYRYFATSDLSADLGIPVEADYTSHSVMAGLRLNF